MVALLLWVLTKFLTFSAVLNKYVYHKLYGTFKTDTVSMTISINGARSTSANPISNYLNIEPTAGKVSHLVSAKPLTGASTPLLASNNQPSVSFPVCSSTGCRIFQIQDAHHQDCYICIHDPFKNRSQQYIGYIGPILSRQPFRMPLSTIKSYQWDPNPSRTRAQPRLYQSHS